MQQRTTASHWDRAFLHDSPKLHAYLQDHPHERGEVRFLQSIAEEGMTAVDIGSHVGIAAVTIAKSVGPTGTLHCFEPTQAYFDALNRNVALNDLQNVHTHCIAVTDRAGECVVHKDGAATSIVPRPTDERFTVHTITLDCFSLQEKMTQIDLLNVDCEGSELLALHGAAGILRRGAPQIFVEIHHDTLPYFNHDVGDVVAYLQDLDFVVRAVRLDKLGFTADFKTCEYVYAFKEDWRGNSVPTTSDRA